MQLAVKAQQLKYKQKDDNRFFPFLTYQQLSNLLHLRALHLEPGSELEPV